MSEDAQVYNSGPVGRGVIELGKTLGQLDGAVESLLGERDAVRTERDALRAEVQALREAVLAACGEKDELEGEIARLREERRTAKTELVQSTVSAREQLRDAMGRLENIRQQTNRAESELNEVRKVLASKQSEHAQALARR